MSKSWVLDVEPEGSKAGVWVVRLGIKDAQSGKVTPIGLSSGSLGELQKEIATLKSELDGVLDAASRKLEALARAPEGEGAMGPDQVWKKMESFATDTEMVDYFNALGESERERVAEYIFSHVSMFKGRGPVFSERYDTSSHLLE